MNPVAVTKSKGSGIKNSFKPIEQLIDELYKSVIRK